MKVLIVSNLFPPRVVGGAEVAAYSWARWLAAHGHQVRVLTTSFPDGPEGIEETGDGIAVERRELGYIYPLGKTDRPATASKAIWHLQDHFGQSARRWCAQAIEDFRPDIVNCHNLQGLGYAVLHAIAASGRPCVQTLHDLGFLCVNMAMYKSGAECSRHHFVCQASALLKRTGWSSIHRLVFWSPSSALLERYRPHLPPSLEQTAIPLPLYFEESKCAPGSRAEIPQLLYVGQVTQIKGVAFLLEVLAKLAGEFAFQLRVVGGGQELERLRELYARAAWVEFVGKVPPEKVGDYMAKSDVLLTPSLWFENSPLVIYQAISLGLPVVASRTGGLPELVADEMSGALVEPGDVAAWTAILRRILGDPQTLVRWGAGADERRQQFSVDSLGERVLALFERTIGVVSHNLVCA